MQIVDALVVTLGLDPSGFIRGQAQASSAFGKTKDAAVKSGKDVEKSAKDMTEALGKATSGVLTLMAAFLGGQGLKQFVGDAVRANTALGVVSSTLGTSSQFVSAWGMAAERMGGSAAAAQSSLQTLSDSLINLNAKGKMVPIEMSMLESATGVYIDLAHGVEAYTISLAAASHEMAKTNPARASNFLRSLNIDPVMANLMIKQGANIRSHLETMKRLAPSDKDVSASGRLTESWAKLNQQFSLLATKIATAIAPALIMLADKIGIVVEAIAHWVERNPEWTTAIVGFIAVLSAGAILLAIKNVLSLAFALRGLAAANELTLGGGLLGFLGRIGLLNPYVAGAVAAGAVMNPGSTNEETSEIERQKKHGQFRGGEHGSGNDAIRRRGRDGRYSSASDIPDGRRSSLSANQQEAYNAARGEGLSDKAARALVANMSGESLANPRNVHWDGSHNAHGIVQWDDVRSAEIARKFGKMPQQMTVAEQTRAAVWEINNHKRFAATAAALRGSNSGAMMGALVGNYESPSDVRGQIAKRSHIYQGLGGLSLGYQRHPTSDGTSSGAPKPPAIWTGSLAGARASLHAGAAQSAALNRISNEYKSTTSSTSNEAHIHGDVNVNAPQATDANGIARGIDAALAHNLFANHANTGPY